MAKSDDYRTETVSTGGQRREKEQKQRGGGAGGGRKKAERLIASVSAFTVASSPPLPLLPPSPLAPSLSQQKSH